MTVEFQIFKQTKEPFLVLRARCFNSASILQPGTTLAGTPGHRLTRER